MNLAQEVLDQYGEDLDEKTTPEDIWLTKRSDFLTSTMKVLHNDELIPALRKKAQILARLLYNQGARSR